MLLNEFLKEHCKIEELRKNFESKLAQQQQQIGALTSTLERVNARIELSRAVTGTRNIPLMVAVESVTTALWAVGLLCLVIDWPEVRPRDGFVLRRISGYKVAHSF